MAEVICARVIWDRHAIPLGRLPGRWHDLHISPEPGWPFGRRGLALASAWQQLQMSCAETGMLTLDGDVACDPCDIAAMLAAAAAEPAAVHTAPARIWPATTGRREWTWAHWRDQPSQQDCGDPSYFTFCLTYLPRALLEVPALKVWAYPSCAARMSAAAVKGRIPVRVVDAARPVHLHY